MERSLHPRTFEPIDGLVDLVEHHLSLPATHQPKPLSKENTDRYGQVDPSMWTRSDDRILTLKDNFAEIMKIVKTFKIDDITIVDR